MIFVLKQTRLERQRVNVVQANININNRGGEQTDRYKNTRNIFENENSQKIHMINPQCVGKY